jgi:uncharacterized membrane protein
VVALAAALSGAAPAYATSEPGYAPGRVFNGMLVMGGKQVPLPGGEWTVLGYDANTIRAGDGKHVGLHGAIENLVLARIVDKRVEAMVEINANAISTEDGWGMARDCTRREHFVAATRYRTGWDASCFFIKRTLGVALDSSPAAWRKAVAESVRQLLVVPREWLTVGLRVSSRSDVVDMRFHLDPARLGFRSIEEAAGGGFAWQVADLKNDTGRLKLFEDLMQWSIDVGDTIERGISNQIVGPVEIALPTEGSMAARRAEREARLRGLDGLLASGAITKAEHERQRHAILNDQEVQPNEGRLSMAMRKNISFRVFGSVVDYILAFVVTLSSPLSAYITASIVAIHSVIFVFNDNYWEGYWAERGRRTDARAVDFAYLGADPWENV